MATRTLAAGAAAAATLALATTAVHAQTWQVVADGVLTVALGVDSTANAVFVTGGDDGTGAAILRSTDRGETWSKMAHDNQMMYLDIAVNEDESGVAAGMGMFQAVTGISFSNGQEWVSSPDPYFVSAFQSVQAGRNGSLYLVGVWQDSVGTPVGEGVISSYDGGASLNYHSWGLIAGARYGSFPSDDAWFVSGGTWSAKAQDPGAATRGMFSSKFKLNQRTMRASLAEPLDESIKAYIAVIGKSTDQGRTWQEVYLDTGRFYLNGISCPDVNHCWVVGEGDTDAIILATADGGNTWQEQYIAVGISLIGVEMIDILNGWAVGGVLSSSSFEGVFLRTSDGGRSWTPHVVPDVYINCLDVYNNSTAYATAFLADGRGSILAFK